MGDDDAHQYLETVRDWIRWGGSRFHEAGLHFGHGTDNALDEAAHLVLHALELPLDLPDPYLAARLTPAEREVVHELLVARVTTRRPASYLTHRAWFAGLEFYVDERVLVPRSPVAELIEDRFEPWVEPDEVERILDLGTGGGCIAIACAYAFPWARVDAADIDPGALEVAQENIHRHGLDEQVRALTADVFRGLEGQTYDLIVTNPPYVDAGEMEALPAEYRHEPAHALAAGDDGLDIVRRILDEAAEHLNPGGLLVVEVGASMPAVREAWPDWPLHWFDFERGGDGVFGITREELESARNPA
ncbi:MAG: 50S ribosomal protein L3 N(5)-glutamine methyltransferase [Thiohalospira sp.]